MYWNKQMKKVDRERYQPFSKYGEWSNRIVCYSFGSNQKQF